MLPTYTILDILANFSDSFFAVLISTFVILEAPTLRRFIDHVLLSNLNAPSRLRISCFFRFIFRRHAVAALTQDRTQQSEKVSSILHRPPLSAALVTEICIAAQHTSTEFVPIFQSRGNPPFDVSQHFLRSLDTLAREQISRVFYGRIPPCRLENTHPWNDVI